MSDFLLNLARRSAGIAPSVRARDLPPPEIATASLAEAAPASGNVPVPSAPAPAGVIQRESLPPTIAAPSNQVAAAAVPLSPVPAPDIAAASMDASSAHEAATPTVLPVIAPAAEPQRDAVSATATTQTLVEHHMTRVVELVPSPVALLPRREDGQSNAAAAVRVEAPQAPPADRVVQVRIGAIEIVGPSAPVLPRAAPPVAPPPARGQGFDDFSALRSYAPFQW